MQKKMKRAAQKGFTLIELLIVIGLLGALTALVLPSLSANREDALGDVCDYNQAGTLRTLTQFYDLYGGFPNQLHMGTQGTTGGVAMKGIPEAQQVNMGDGVTGTTASVLTADQIDSLEEAGVTDVASGYGYIITPIDGTIEFPDLTAWVDDESVPMTFNGISIADWEAGTTTPDAAQGSGRVICLWVTPTADWENANVANPNLDWSKGNVTLKVSLPGKCPIPNASLSGDDVDFNYYMAYIKVYDDPEVPARLIGTSCPECGIMNP